MSAQRSPAEVIALNMGPVVIAEVENIRLRVMPTVATRHALSGGGATIHAGLITVADLNRLVELAKRGATAVSS